MQKVLFVCIENAGSSKMTESFAKKYGRSQLIASSAGNKPTDKVNPAVTEAKRQRSIALSENKPRAVTFRMTEYADLIGAISGNGKVTCFGPCLSQQSIASLIVRKEKPLKESGKSETISSD